MTPAHSLFTSAFATLLAISICLAGMAPAWAEGKPEGKTEGKAEAKPAGKPKEKAKEEVKRPANEIIAKAPPNVIALPRTRLAIRADENHNYRMLDVEVWISVTLLEDAPKIASQKGKIVDLIKEEALKSYWETYKDPKEGPIAVKKMVRNAINKAIPATPPIDDVLIRTMILR